jgi:hypothetical protein
VLIQVFQGEHDTAAKNDKLGVFELPGIAPAPRGVPQIEVAFEIDSNGILNVSAMNLATGKRQAVTISDGYTLAKSDLERMTADAEMYAAEDRRRRDETEARNHAAALAAATEESLAGSSGNVPDDVAAELRSAVANLKEALGGTNVADAIRAAAQEVGQASQKMQITIFAQTQRWMDRKQPEAAAGMAVGSVEVWPRSFSQWSNDPAGHAEQSWQLICRICGDRWDRNPDGLPTGLETLRGPYASTQEAEKAGTSHLRDRHYGEIPNLRPPGEVRRASL